MLLTATPLEDGSVVAVRVSKCERCEGESVVMNRKNKLIFIFDLTLTLRYEATLTPPDAAAAPSTLKGEMTLRDVASDGSAPQLKVSADEVAGLAKESARIAQLVRSEGKEPLLRLADALLDEMRAQIDGVQAPAPTAVAAAPAAVPAAAAAAALKGAASASPSAPSKTVSLTQTLECDVPARELFACLTDASRVQAFTGAPASVEARIGAALALYGGAVVGEVVDCRAHDLLVLRWRAQSWPAGSAASLVTLRFEALDGNRSRLSLKHAELPAAELERTGAFWEQQFWTRMRALFGWRLTLL